MLGIRKLNMTAYHPQCDGMVERFNRTLKTILRKHAARFGNQWDRYLSGVLWAYRNTPHGSTSEKPSFLLFGRDFRTPTEVYFMPASPVYVGAVEDYREELMVSLSSARELTVENIQKAQEKYKRNYDRRVSTPSSPMKCGDWVLVHFPHEESGPNRKLSRPWHGPYRIISVNDPDLSIVKCVFPAGSVNPSAPVPSESVSSKLPQWVLLVRGEETWTRPSTEVGVESAQLPGLREGDCRATHRHTRESSETESGR